MNGKHVKIIGTLLTILGLGVNIATGFIDGKKLDSRIAEEVCKQLKK